MFRSLGNLRQNERVGLLSIDFEQPQRLRVAVDLVFPNCPRYVHRMRRLDVSPYVPVAGVATPEPA